MNAVGKGVLLGAVHTVLVLSLGGKLLYDRMTRPRGWALTQGYDPELPMRGRYLTQRLRMPAEGYAYTEGGNGQGNPWYLNRSWAYLESRNGGLVAKAFGHDGGGWVVLQKRSDGALEAVTEEPVLLFIPENATTPVLRPGEEMWMEVTLPAKGPPRPIRAGMKKGGIIEPLVYK
jgi:hypothetical protein